MYHDSYVTSPRFFSHLHSGMETDSAYPQVLMPEGKLTIDGFLCCFDVSKVPQRSIEKQVENVAALLNNAIKTKKPVILATTKNDGSCQVSFSPPGALKQKNTVSAECLKK